MSARYPLPNITADAIAVDKVLTRMTADALSQRIQRLVNDELAQLAARADDQFMLLPESHTLRVFMDRDRVLWAAWIDVCTLADVTNPALEGGKLTKVRVPSLGKGAALTIVRADEVVPYLLRRRVRYELASAAAGEITAIARAHGIALG